ncbi:tetratricopeptide repeat protein [Chromobacterium vaccinii]|uniref:tetratricopeptide repeat protein n=1 Tax=Chromobacterium vaccinii TaxID=1108595 RepID=UPI000617CAB7|nr:tetratricopeptide repeat protein [Chromobacterium vaccinii]
MSLKSIALGLAAAMLLQAGMALADSPELEAACGWYWLHPYQPEAINRLALQLLKAGDADSAAVLLERAARIAPDRQDIRANLLRLKSGSRRVADAPWQEDGRVVNAVPNAAAPASQDELPAPWPLPPSHP